MSKTELSPNASGSSRSMFHLMAMLILFVGGSFLAGGIGGFATMSSVETWYLDLNKPSWNPPKWIFGPVWSTLYLMMGVAAWLVWKNAASQVERRSSFWALVVFGIHLVLNTLWSVLFFGLRQPGWAFAEITILWASIVLCIILFWRHSKLACLLMIPYLLWVSFAGFLNYTIWILN